MYKTSLRKFGIVSLLLIVGVLHSMPTAAAGFDVCIDPGHSLSEVGAVNVDYNLQEVDINLDVSRKVAALLSENSSESPKVRTVIYTWHDDATVSAGNRNGNLNSRQRAKICNNAGARTVVSIHTNSVANNYQDGVWMGYHGSESVGFAQDMADRLWQALFTGSPFATADARNYGPQLYANGVLIWTKVPAVLVEPVFMSNAAEAAVLVESISECGNAAEEACRRAQIAAAIAAGVEAQLTLLDNAPPDGGGGNGGGGHCNNPKKPGC